MTMESTSMIINNNPKLSSENIALYKSIHHISLMSMYQGTAASSNQLVEHINSCSGT
jgi:hypothetical protein